jgi:hypothetical protein
MRKKLIASLSILAIFAFAIAAFAYAQTTNTLADKPSCCGDSCPMTKKGHDGHDAKAEHAKMDCCKKHDGSEGMAEGKSCCGDSCPMKKKGEGAATTAATAPAAEGKGGCDCCGDSCPMKKKSEGAAAAATSAEGEDCCCDCCKAEKETSA